MLATEPLFTTLLGSEIRRFLSDSGWSVDKRPALLILSPSTYVILTTAVAGPKMTHLLKITLAFEFSVLEGARAAPPEISESPVFLPSYAIFELLNRILKLI
jgi:hypothetical protein